MEHAKLPGASAGFKLTAARDCSRPPRRPAFLRIVSHAARGRISALRRALPPRAAAPPRTDRLLILRLLIGASLAAAIAAAAWRARMLSGSGALAALVVGTAAAAPGRGWAVLLIGYFIATSALSRVGAARKAVRTGHIVAKGGRRDAVQVAANGGVYGLAAVGMTFAPSAVWWAAGAGAIAAAAADSWATEIGTLARREPRSILTGRPVPAGTSGGVSWPGSLAGVAGAIAVAAGAALMGAPLAAAISAAGGGVIGMVIDSLLGATVQGRRRCPACATSTERIVHGCGTRSEPAGGVQWMNNDAVNLACTAVGAAVAAGLWNLSR